MKEKGTINVPFFAEGGKTGMDRQNLYEDERREMLVQLAKSDGTTIGEHNLALRKRADVLLEYKYIENDIYDLLCKACDYHDLGKANPVMQERLRNKKIKFDSNKEIPHNILSMYLISREEQSYTLLQFAVGFHHDYGDVFNVLEDREKQILAKKLLEKWGCAKKPERGMLKDIKRYAKLPEYSEQRNKMILLKGLLHKCDYAASADTEIEYKNDFLMEKTEGFFEKNKYRKNEMQEFCLKMQDKNIIIVGQTGMGKTEASLLWIGDNKGFIFLPVKTAINKMYSRISEEILSDEDDNLIEKRLGLLHSDAISKLLESRQISKSSQGVIEDLVQREMDIMEYYSRSRQLSIPLTISTVDQLFDFVFQYQTYELKLATLSYSKIVIDEIQMYGADLLADLIFGMKMICQLGGKIAIMTATLAPFVKDLIEKETGCFEQGVFCNKNQIRHKVKLIPELMNVDAIIEKFESCLNKEESEDIKKVKGSEFSGGKILVICNTIKKAQWTYREICRKIDEKNRNRVHLLHSRFTRHDRSQKESEICECGKTEHEETVIWISTSLVEASLDIDFDYLFTELQDVPSLLQRMGRINRKGKKSVNDYNCYVYTEIEEYYLEVPSNAHKSIDGRGFIDADIFKMSQQALEETLRESIEGILSEGDKLKMMNYFTTDKMAGTCYMEKYLNQMKKLQEIVWYEFDKKDVALREDIHTRDVIPYDIYEQNKQEIKLNAELMRSVNTHVVEKVKAHNSILQYTVPVANYIVSKYNKAVNRGMSARACCPVKIGAYESIPVVDCDYSRELGFEEKEFKIEDKPIMV